MSKGLEQLLARIIENPTRMMIDRYLALLADLSEDEGKTSRALDLAAGLIRVDALQALRIAFMVHQTKPDDLRAYDLMIEGLNNRGRHAKAEVLRLERARLVEALAAEAHGNGRLSVVDTRSGYDQGDDLNPVDELSEVSLSSSPAELALFDEPLALRPTAYTEDIGQAMDGIAALDMDIGGLAAPADALPYAEVANGGGMANAEQSLHEAASYAPDLFEWQSGAQADEARAASPPWDAQPSPAPSGSSARDELQLFAPQGEEPQDTPRQAPVSITRLLEIGGLGVSVPAPSQPPASAAEPSLPRMPGVLLDAPADEGEQPLFQLKTVGPIVQPPSLRVTVATPMVVSQAARFEPPRDVELEDDFSEELSSFAVQPVPEEALEPKPPAPVPRIDVTHNPHRSASLPAPSSAQQQAAYTPRVAAPAAAAAPAEVSSQAAGAASITLQTITPAQTIDPFTGRGDTGTGTSSAGISLDLFGPSALNPSPESPSQAHAPGPAEALAPVTTHSPNPGQKTTVVAPQGPKRKASQATTVSPGNGPAQAEAAPAKTAATAAAKPQRKSVDFATASRTKLSKHRAVAKAKAAKPVPASGLSQFWSTLVGAFGHLEAVPVGPQDWDQGTGKSRQLQLEPLPEGFWRALAAIPQEQLTQTDRPLNLQLLAEILTSELDEPSASAFAALLEHLQLIHESPALWGLYLDTLVFRGMQRKALVEVRTLLNQRPQPVWAVVAWPRLPLIWKGLAVQGFDWREEAGVMALIKGLERRPKAKSWGMVV